MATLRHQYEEKLKAAAALATKSDLTDAESVELKERTEEVLTLRGQIKAQEMLHDVHQDFADSDFYSALKASGWTRQSREAVLLPAKSILRGPRRGAKTAIVATAGDARPTRELGVVPKGLDERYVYVHLATQDHDFSDSKVQYMRQTTETLPAAADTQIAYGATTTKPEVVVQATLQSVAPTTIAQTSEKVQNQLFDVPELREMLDRSLGRSYRNGLEDLVLDKLIAENGLTASIGAEMLDDFILTVRNDIWDAGFDADLFVVGNGVAEAFYKTKDADEHYLREWGQDVHGVKIIVSTQISESVGLGIDSSQVKLSLSPVAFDVDPYSDFTTNESRARLEGSAAVLIKSPNAVLEAAFS